MYKPKVVEALQGMFIRKVCAGSQSSLALTSTGQVWHITKPQMNGQFEFMLTVLTLMQCMFIIKTPVIVCNVQVYAWGCGACLGCGSSEATALRPKLIEELATTRVVDISIGDSHCLALSHGKGSLQTHWYALVVGSATTFLKRTRCPYRAGQFIYFYQGSYAALKSLKFEICLFYLFFSLLGIRS